MSIDWYNSRVRGTFSIIVIIATLFIFGNIFNNFSDILNIQLLKQNGFFSWAVLLLCIVWIWTKRAEIDVSHAKFDVRWTCLGIGLFIPAVVLLSFLSGSVAGLPLKIFAIGLIVVSTFCIFFGHASKIPLMILAVYGIAVGFPLLVESLISSPFSTVTAVFSTLTLRIFGIPVSLEGVTVTLTSLNGSNIVTMVDSRCSGSDSIAIFFAIFGLMLIDKKPKNFIALELLIFGVAGTYVQNFMRLLLLFTAGYYYGPDSLWLVHDYASYVLFPIWFLIFSLIYVKYANNNKNSSCNTMKSF
jgi:exosortase/archaeosortase family protein